MAWCALCRCADRTVLATCPHISYSHILISISISISISIQIFIPIPSTRQHHPVTATALHHNICTIPELLEVYHTFHTQFFSCQTPFCHFPSQLGLKFSHFMLNVAPPRAESPVSIRACIFHLIVIPNTGETARCGVPRPYLVLAHTEGEKNKGY